MTTRIAGFYRDPFVVDVRRGGHWLVDSGTGDILYGCAGFHASNGLAFTLERGSKGYLLTLRSSGFKCAIGWTNDYETAHRWVEDVNAFLATKVELHQPDTAIYLDRGGRPMTEEG